MFDVNKLQVAKPCNVGWENMSGDERKRFCGECKLHVYNVAGMTKPEVTALIADANGGRLCVRLFKRADGTVLTKDCPVGFRAYQKRIAKFAGAAFATVLGLFTFSPAQTNSNTNTTPSTATTKNVSDASLSGTVTNQDGAVIPGINVSLFIEDSKKLVATTKTDGKGLWEFKDLAPDQYRVEIRSKEMMFKTTIIDKILLSANSQRTFNLTLEYVGAIELVGVVGIVDDPLVEKGSSEVKFTITNRLIRSLPF